MVWRASSGVPLGLGGPNPRGVFSSPSNSVGSWTIPPSIASTHVLMATYSLASSLLRSLSPSLAVPGIPFDGSTRHPRSVAPASCSASSAQDPEPHKEQLRRNARNGRTSLPNPTPGPWSAAQVPAPSARLLSHTYTTTRLPNVRAARRAGCADARPVCREQSGSCLYPQRRCSPMRPSTTLNHRPSTPHPTVYSMHLTSTVQGVPPAGGATALMERARLDVGLRRGPCCARPSVRAALPLAFSSVWYLQKMAEAPVRRDRSSRSRPTESRAH